MTDREKVICAIKNCIAVPKCRDCPWEECEEQHVTVDGIPLGLMHEALALMEAQEPTEPGRAGFPDASRSYGTWYYICGACGGAIDYKDKFCRWCGRSVKWE